MKIQKAKKTHERPRKIWGEGAGSNHRRAARKPVDLNDREDRLHSIKRPEGLDDWLRRN